MQPGSTPDTEFEKWHARAQSRDKSGSVPKEVPEISDETDAASNSNEEYSIKELINDPPSSQQDYCSAFPPSSLDTPALTIGLPSPLSSPPSAIMTPMDKYSRPYPTINGDQQLSDDLDLASLFMCYPELIDCGDGRLHIDHILRGDPLNNSSHEFCFSKQNNREFTDGHCGCLNQVANYTAVLELSLRLRKATDILNRSSNHRLNNGGCALGQRIADLDHFAK